MFTLPRELWQLIGYMLEPHAYLMWTLSCKYFCAFRRPIDLGQILISAVECHSIHLVKYLLREWPLPNWGLKYATRIAVSKLAAQGGTFKMLRALGKFPLENDRIMEAAIVHGNLDAFIYGYERYAAAHGEVDFMVNILNCDNLQLLDYMMQWPYVELWPNDIESMRSDKRARVLYHMLDKYGAQPHLDLESYVLADDPNLLYYYMDLENELGHKVDLTDLAAIAKKCGSMRVLSKVDDIRDDYATT